MDEKKRLDDTISGMSLQDILDEINNDFSDDNNDVSIDEILAEFSGEGRKSDTYTSKTDDTGTVADTKEQSPKKRSEEGQRKKEEINSEKITHIDTYVRNDIIGRAEDTHSVKKSKKGHKANNTAVQLAETFDTLTRSELFEGKNDENVLETRSVEEIIKENSKLSKLLGIRTVFLLILSVLSCYLAFSEPLGWYLPRFISYLAHPFRYLFLTIFFEICAMLLSVDVLSRGLGSLFTLKPNADSAIAFSSFATLIHAITIMVAPHWRGWLPYSCISVVSLFFTIYGKWINTRALCRVCKVVKAAKQPNAVYVQEIYNENYVIKKTVDDTRSFVSHINDKDASATFWTFLSPIVIVSSVVFAAIASFGTKTPQHFFWALAGISSVSAPFFTMLSFSVPFSVTAKALASVGTAISGWFSATTLTKRANVVACDRDLFPKGSVSIHGLKVLGNFTLEQTISYASSLIGATKSGLTDVFSDLLKSHYGVKTKVSNLRYHEDGGIEAEIRNDSVLMGTAEFMRRSGVKLPVGSAAKNAVFIAINKCAAGVFNINYKAGADVERALHVLIKKKVPVILAVRDFNIRPTMVEEAFELKNGYLDYPEVEQRVDLSGEDQFTDGDAAAIITRSGMYPLSSALIATKKLRRATIRNVFLTAVAALIGMVFMFCLMFIQKPILVTPHTVFVYMFLWCLPTYLLSMRVKK